MGHCQLVREPHSLCQDRRCRAKMCRIPSTMSSPNWRSCGGLVGAQSACHKTLVEKSTTIFGESAIIPSQRPPWARPPSFTRFVVSVAIGLGARDASPPGMALSSTQKG
eukprot:3407937-Amphidinium_carterae.1